jgi:hypothetical protein
MDLDRKKIGYIVGAVALLGFCSAAMRSPKPAAIQPTVVEPRAVEPPPEPRRGPGELAALLDRIAREPGKHSTGKDDTGTKTVTYNLKPMEGVGLAYFVGARGQAKVWRFGLEGMRCDRIAELGVEVVTLQQGDGRPLSASWYRIKGGPLEGLLVKVFLGEGPGLCNVMPGTPPYWKHQGEHPPGEE